jgi:hypothetical protein
MAESRVAPRLTAKQKGKALIGSGKELDCTVRDLSTLGARLSFMNPAFLPRQFRLQFDGHDEKVTVVWQAGVLAGVRFQKPIHGLPQVKKRMWPWSRR